MELDQTQALSDCDHDDHNVTDEEKSPSKKKPVGSKYN